MQNFDREYCYEMITTFKIMNISITCKISTYPWVNSTSCSSSLPLRSGNQWSVFSLVSLRFLVFYKNRRYSLCLTSFIQNNYLEINHVLSCIDCHVLENSFFKLKKSIAELYCIIWIYHNLSVQLLMNIFIICSFWLYKKAVMHM